jgi:hypothetical protein
VSQSFGYIPKSGMQYTFLSVAHGTFSKINHILSCKASLNEFMKSEIIPCIILTQWNKIRTQQKKLQKIFEHMETKQDIAKCLSSKK